MSTDTVRYTRCDHGQWLQDGPCGACEARRNHRGFNVTPYMRERLTAMAGECDSLAVNVNKAQQILALMAQATTHEEFQLNADAYAMLASVIRIQAANL